jgi:hypothetical protein
VTGNRTTIDSRPRSVHSDQIVLVTPCVTCDALVVVPVDGERGAVETATCPGLLGVVDAKRAQQRDTEVALGADQ